MAHRGFAPGQSFCASPAVRCRIFGLLVQGTMPKRVPEIACMAAASSPYWVERFNVGADRARWPARSSKPVGGVTSLAGGFDSHAPSPAVFRALPEWGTVG